MGADPRCRGGSQRPVRWLVYVALANRATPLAIEAVEGFVPLTAAWFIGDSVAARHRYVAGLAEQAERERAAEVERARQQVREERMRIAHELHDVAAHTLAVITVQDGWAGVSWPSSPRRRPPHSNRSR
jgi:signal transduction histidine kinase